MSITITPFLTVRDCKMAIAFYTSAWGALIVEHFVSSNEKISAKISIEGAVFWVGDEEPEFGNTCPDFNSNNSVRIILQTKNADLLYLEAIKNGAAEICPMRTEADWRIGKLKDPFGHVWEIGYEL
jgi:PhnB protein